MYPTRSLDSRAQNSAHESEPQSLLFKRLDDRAILPARGSAFAAGLDLCSIEAVVIGSKQRGVVPTGLAVDIPEGYYGRVAPRSGLAIQRGLDVLAGVIDSDYRGEIRCVLYNTGDETIELPAGAKICQLIIEKISTPVAVWSDDISETERGSGGFGSTG